MTDITDPAAVKFCNERVRVAADRLAQAFNFANETLDLWFAQGHNVTITNNAADIAKLNTILRVSVASHR